MTMTIGKHHEEQLLKVNKLQQQHKRIHTKVHGLHLSGHYSNRVQHRLQPRHLTGLTNTILHLAYLAWRRLRLSWRPAEEGRSTTASSPSIVTSLRVASGERVGLRAKFSSESLPSKSRTIENRPNNSQMQQDSERKYLERTVEISQLNSHESTMTMTSPDAVENDRRRLSAPQDSLYGANYTPPYISSNRNRNLKTSKALLKS